MTSVVYSAQLLSDGVGTTETIPAASNISSKWYSFETNNTDIFATETGTTFPYVGETNTEQDKVLKLKQAGLYYMEFYVEYANGTYSRNININCNAHEIGTAARSIEDGWGTSTFDYNTKYGLFLVDESNLPEGQFANFLIYNNHPTLSKTVYRRGVSIVKLPADGSRYQVF